MSYSSAVMEGLKRGTLQRTDGRIAFNNNRYGVYNVGIIDDNKMVSLRVLPKFMHYNFACLVCEEGHNLYLVPSTVRLGCCVILKFRPSHINVSGGIRVMACERARMPAM
jgi:hypothetical protein